MSILLDIIPRGDEDSLRFVLDKTQPRIVARPMSEDRNAVLQQAETNRMATVGCVKGCAGWVDAKTVAGRTGVNLSSTYTYLQRSAALGDIESTRAAVTNRVLYRARRK